MKKIFTKAGIGLGFLLILSTISYAQQKKDVVTIHGRIVDGVSNTPLSAASIVALSVKDSSVIDGSRSSEKGVFSLSIEKRDSLLIKVSHLGFQELFLPLLIDKDDISVDDLQLFSSSNQLNELTVSAEKRPMYEYKKDSTIFNVPENFQPGGDVKDVLEFTPSLTIDPDGNILIEGEGNIGFYVDGKPLSDLGMGVNEYLQNTPAFMVERVEILETPPDPEDAAKALAAGITDRHYVNIITRKIKFKGYNAELTAGMNSHNNRTIRMRANMNLDPLRLDYNNNFGSNEDSSYLHRISFGKREEDSSFLDQNSYRENKSMNHNLNARYDFKFTENEELRIQTRLGWRDSKNDRNELNRITGFLKEQNQTRFQETNNRSYGYNASTNLDYKKKYDQEGKELKATVNLNQGSNKNNRFSTDHYLIKGDSLIQENRGNNLNRGLRTNLQYKNNFGKENKHFFLLNGSFSYNDRHNLSDVNRTDTTLHPPLLRFNRLLSSNYYSTDNNYGSLFIIGKRDEKLGWQFVSGVSKNNSENHDDYRKSEVKNEVLAFRNSLGMNFSPWEEHTVHLNFNPGVQKYDQQTKPNDTTEMISYKYTHFIPGASASYRLKDHQLSFNYDKDLRMPNWWQLNPFVDNSDPLNIHTGNPDLRPSFTNRYRLRYRYKKKFFYVTLNLSDRISTDVISSYKSVDENGVSTQTFVNLNKETRRSAQLNAGLNYFKNYDWDAIINLNAEGSLSAYTNQSNDEHVSQDFRDVSGVTSSGKLWSSFKYKSYSLIVDGRYWGPQYFSQGKRPARFNTGLRAKAEFWDHSLTVNLGINNLFGASVNNNFYKTDNYIQTNSNRRNVRSFSLYISYQFKHYQKTGDADS